MEKIELKMVGDGNVLSIILDGTILFQKTNLFANWMYIHNVDGILIRDHLKRFDDSLLKIFLDDITDQLNNGVDKNDLSMNIPKRISRIKCGDRIVDIEE